MLEELSVRDFQAHAKTRVRFGPRLTAITGATDAGKSALLRALRWLCLNKPGGEAFVRDGADGTRVKLRVDGRAVIRARGKRGNTYKLDGTTLRAFGAAPPDAVAQLLNVTPSSFQGQHDAPFWFADTAGDVSRNLNAVIDLGAIDTVLAKLNADLRAANARADVLVAQVQTAKENRDGLAWATDADEALARAEGLGRRAAETRATVTRLREAAAGVREHAGRRDRAAECVLTAMAVVAYGNVWAKLARERDNLRNLAETVRRLEPLAARDVPDLSEVERLDARYARTLQRVKALNSARNIVEGAMARVRLAERAAAEVESEFHNAMGDTCPLCNQTITR